MKKSDENIEKQVEAIWEYFENIHRVEPPESFVGDVMARYERENDKRKSVSTSFMIYMRIAASLIIFAVIGNLLILVTSLKQSDSSNDMLSEFSSEYNIDKENQWWTNLASGTYYDFNKDN